VNARGMTLPEVVVGIAILTAVMGAVVTLLIGRSLLIKRQAVAIEAGRKKWRRGVFRI